MDYRTLGRTGLKVSSLCLGTMQWGWTADEQTSFTVMDAFLDEGGNFLDSANIYSRWVEGNQGGDSERIIGKWMQTRKNRTRVIVATKARGTMGPGPNDEGLSRKHLIEAVEQSLRRLQTDYIDVYQTHWFDENTPIDETMMALDMLVRQGKVRYVGCSNHPAWRLVESLWASDKHDYVRYESIQPHYNLAYREEFERELQEVVSRYNIGVIPYSPLAGGFLTGKYTRETSAASPRAASVERRYFNDQGWRVIDSVRAVAQEADTTPASVALAWLLAQPHVTAPIIGANSIEQLHDSLNATKIALTTAQISDLDTASAWQEEK